MALDKLHCESSFAFTRTGPVLPTGPTKPHAVHYTGGHTDTVAPLSTSAISFSEIPQICHDSDAAPDNAALEEEESSTVRHRLVPQGRVLRSLPPLPV